MTSLNQNYKHLTSDEVSHFLEHGWVKFSNAMNPDIVDKWMSDLYIRMDMDEHDKSTWTTEYQHLPKHHEVPPQEFCPEAWEKFIEICGGGLNVEKDRMDDLRETWYGDAFIVNMGTEAKSKPDYHPPPPNTKEGWHVDNDWYRLFLDLEMALTLVFLWTDIPANGGGTWICEDGITQVSQYLLDNRQGLDVPYEAMDTICAKMSTNKKLTQVSGKKGDIIVTHGRLPHTVGDNRLHYARVITNPHISLKKPMNFNREDGNYSLVEQKILNSLGRTSIPEYAPTREHTICAPRNVMAWRSKAHVELKRLEAAALAKGLPIESIYSIYQKEGTQAWRDYEHRNGFDKPISPAGFRRPEEDKSPNGRHVNGLDSPAPAHAEVSAAYHVSTQMTVL